MRYFRAFMRVFAPGGTFVLGFLSNTEHSIHWLWWALGVICMLWTSLALWSLTARLEEAKQND